MIGLPRFAIPLALALVACGGGSTANAPQSSSPAPTGTGSIAQGSCTGAGTLTPPPPGASPRPAAGLTVPPGLRIEVIAHVADGPRELSFAPNGDLFAGTNRSTIYLISNAEDAPATPVVFATFSDAPAAGVAVNMANCSIYVGTQFGVYRIPYVLGDRSARSLIKIASLRPGGSGDHSTTTVAVSGQTLYASVGSSCNACSESDPTRATIQQMHLDGSGMIAKATHIRNAIALTVHQSTGAVWAGVAGQDSLPQGHPYEFFDDVTAHSGVVDYGWPDCEENHVAYTAGADCSRQAVPLVEFPAYQTIIGATFYEPSAGAKHALPAQYRQGAFVSMHGSWHANGAGVPIAPPQVAFVPMSADVPQQPLNWSTPTTQWTPFVTGFQRSNGSRIGRSTGIAIGPEGSLFVADDETGYIYRIRP